MRYFKNKETLEVFAFDETDETQLPYMQQKIDDGLEDITPEWEQYIASQKYQEIQEIQEEQVNPVDKLKTFLADNPDVAALLGA